MKAKAVSGLLDLNTVVSLDADISDLRPLEEFSHNQYQEGALERILHNDELQCKQESGHRDVNYLTNVFRAFLCLALLLV